MYELIFETEPLADEVEDQLYDALDAVVSRHGPTTMVIIDADGVSARSAAFSAARMLDDAGACVVRLCEDLVSRAMIAERAGVTPQNVGQWIRGERQGERAFPRPFTQAGAELYLWGDVNQWLVPLGKSDGLQHPSLADYSGVNASLMSKANDERQGWQRKGFAEIAVSTSVAAAGPPVMVRPQLIVVQHATA